MRFGLRGETVEQKQGERHVVILHAQLSLTTVSAASVAVLPDYSQQVPLLQSFAVNKFQWKTSHALSEVIYIIAALSGTVSFWRKQFLSPFHPSSRCGTESLTCYPLKHCETKKAEKKQKSSKSFEKVLSANNILLRHVTFLL